MKILVIVFFLFEVTGFAFAQPADSIAYAHQREKVNNLLGKRSTKFKQYFQSLDLHTGIFGLQTKKDIRRSNEILMDIVQTDNAVFKELKILLDYRTTVLSETQDRSTDSENRNTAYMGTINKLRSQITLAQQQNQHLENEAAHYQRLFIITAIIAAVLLLLFITAKSTKAR